MSSAVVAPGGHVEKVAGELKLRRGQVEAVAGLLAEGSTVPFIARYRKEATGTLDEVAITAIRDRLEQLAELDKRREAILESLKERGLLTGALEGAIGAAETVAGLEDVYAPYRPKKRTRAMIAREAGLGALAEMLLAQDAVMDVERAAAGFVNGEKGVEDVAGALQGARDIVAEMVSDHAEARAALRALYWAKGVVTAKRIPGEGEKPGEAAANLLAEVLKYKDYFEWSEPLAKIPSHRLLAIRRGAAENVLYFKIAPPEGEAVAVLEPLFVKNGSAAGQEVKQAVGDAWKRLLSLSMETEIRLASKKKADEAAIGVFATNLRELLMASPLGQKTTLALDPGFRTGCKLVVLDRQGKLLHNDVIYVWENQESRNKKAEDGEAGRKVRELVEKFGVEAIAIGNGTASRETEGFVRKLGLKLPGGEAAVPVILVNESGASIYSASEVAREEFPEHDLTVRGSVSIGRRLQDPLAELVKLDPKSIGVGQYQHDVDQGLLQKSLDDTVVSCVNAVGVELNSASKQLLTYVSGLNPTIAENIVEHRNAHGAFRSRKELLNVPRLGPKTFEQAAGFLRIRDAENPLDGSAVHPERYGLVAQMAKDVGATVPELMKDEAKRKSIDLRKYVADEAGGVGLPTLTDIVGELAKPGRDPREQFAAFAFAEGVKEMKDLAAGMKLPGIVTNVTAFGAFVDVGVHQDGLVHISQLADRFVKDPNEVVKVHQQVMVTVVEVDLARKRIALSMRKGAAAGGGGVKGAAVGKPAAARAAAPAAPGWFSSALESAARKKGGL